jgi:hypothetical protein
MGLGQDSSVPPQPIFPRACLFNYVAGESPFPVYKGLLACYSANVVASWPHSWRRRGRWMCQGAGRESG